MGENDSSHGVRQQPHGCYDCNCAVSIEEAAEKDFCIHKKSLKDQVHICMTIQRICRIGFINVFPGLLKST